MFFLPTRRANAKTKYPFSVSRRVIHRTYRSGLHRGWRRPTEPECLYDELADGRRPRRDLLTPGEGLVDARDFLLWLLTGQFGTTGRHASRATPSHLERGPTRPAVVGTPRVDLWAPSRIRSFHAGIGSPRMLSCPPSATLETTNKGGAR